MPPSLGDRLEHVIAAIDSIELLLKSTSDEIIARTRHQRMILERELEIVCEASRHIPAEIKAQEKAIDWKRMINLGNRLRHAYDSVDLEILLDIARTDLPPLMVFVRRILAKEGKR